MYTKGTYVMLLAKRAEWTYPSSMLPHPSSKGVHNEVPQPLEKGPPLVCKLWLGPDNVRQHFNQAVAHLEELNNSCPC